MGIVIHTYIKVCDVEKYSIETIWFIKFCSNPTYGNTLLWNHLITTLNYKKRREKEWKKTKRFFGTPIEYCTKTFSPHHGGIRKFKINVHLVTWNRICYPGISHTRVSFHSVHISCLPKYPKFSVSSNVYKSFLPKMYTHD